MLTVSGEGHSQVLSSSGGRAFAQPGMTSGHLTQVVSKMWSESRIRDGGISRPRRGLRCRLASPVHQGLETLVDVRASRYIF